MIYFLFVLKEVLFVLILFALLGLIIYSIIDIERRIKMDEEVIKNIEAEIRGGGPS